MSTKYSSFSSSSLERFYHLSRNVSKSCDTFHKLRYIIMSSSHFVEVFSTNLLGTALNLISQSVVPLEIMENHPLLSSVQDLTWTEHDVDYINWLDGDSFKTTYNGERRECRVFGIDSPELDSVLKVNLNYF